MAHEKIEEEICRSLQYGHYIGQELCIARIQIMLPQMLAKPCTSVGPHAIEGRVHHARTAPDISIVMEYPAPASIHNPGRLPSCNRQFLEHPDEWLVACSQARVVGWPVVHLQVDIDGILSIPGSEHLIVPDALQIGGLATGLR